MTRRASFKHKQGLLSYSIRGSSLIAIKKACLISVFCQGLDFDLCASALKGKTSQALAPPPKTLLYLAFNICILRLWLISHRQQLTKTLTKTTCSLIFSINIGIEKSYIPKIITISYIQHGVQRESKPTLYILPHP